jgi:dihydroorotate dehydrogenase
VGTANFYRPDVIADVATGIGRFLERKGLSGAAELTARVRSTERVPEPAQPL